MSLPALFVGSIPDVAGTVWLDHEESHHALAVLRLRAGAEINLLDGHGTLARTRVIGARGALVECEVLERDIQAPVLPRIHLASALPKGDRQNVLLDMATQLGMASFTPLRWARSTATASRNAYPRWERICRSACKQALERHLPELRAELTPVDFVRSLSAADAAVVLADLEGETPGRIDNPVSDIGLVVGPEGGFTDEERSGIRAAGARPVRFSPNILRVETAVVTGLAILRRIHGTD
jgi:16S rRNA (uracil1498-N3)-methyltransferase